MPANRGKHQHTAKAEQMAEHIEDSAKREGRYRGREEGVAWATVHKEMSNARLMANKDPGGLELMHGDHQEGGESHVRILWMWQGR